MSLINEVLGAIGVQGNDPQAQQHQNLMGSLSAMLHNPAMGGIGGLLQKLHAGGLGRAVQSWIGTGQNQAISPDQLRGNSRKSPEMPACLHSRHRPASHRSCRRSWTSLAPTGTFTMRAL